VFDDRLKNGFCGREVAQVMDDERFPVESSNATSAVAPSNPGSIDKLISRLLVGTGSLNSCLDLGEPFLVDLRCATLLMNKLEIAPGFTHHLLGIDQGIPDVFVRWKSHMIDRRA
jgi:hypothetical protein